MESIPSAANENGTVPGQNLNEQSDFSTGFRSPAIGPSYTYFAVFRRRLQVSFKELALPAVAVHKGQVHTVPSLRGHAEQWRRRQSEDDHRRRDEFNWPVRLRCRFSVS